MPDYNSEDEWDRGDPTDAYEAYHRRMREKIERLRRLYSGTETGRFSTQHQMFELPPDQHYDWRRYGRRPSAVQTFESLDHFLFQPDLHWNGKVVEHA